MHQLGTHCQVGRQCRLPEAVVAAEEAATAVAVLAVAAVVRAVVTSVASVRVEEEAR